MEITTEIATPERWDDVQRALTGGGDGRACQCAWWTMTNAEWNATTADDKQQALHDEISRGPSPGIVAYVDGEAAGWVRVGPRTSQARIARTRNIAATTREAADDASVWAVSCFSIRKEHRGKSLMATLLDAAVDYATASGARIIEAYPIDTSGGRQSSNPLFVGTLDTFRRAGFEEVGQRKPGHPLVALALAS